jgi:hypothetical protein
MGVTTNSEEKLTIYSTLVMFCGDVMGLVVDIWGYIPTSILIGRGFGGWMGGQEDAAVG